MMSVGIFMLAMMLAWLYQHGEDRAIRKVEHVDREQQPDDVVPVAFADAELVRGAGALGAAARNVDLAHDLRRFGHRHLHTQLAVSSKSP